MRNKIIALIVVVAPLALVLSACSIGIPEVKVASEVETNSGPVEDGSSPEASNYPVDNGRPMEAKQTWVGVVGGVLIAAIGIFRAVIMGWRQSSSRTQHEEE